MATAALDAAWREFQSLPAFLAEFFAHDGHAGPPPPWMAKYALLALLINEARGLSAAHAMWLEVSPSFLANVQYISDRFS